MANTTGLPVLFATGVHGSRPAASAVGSGGLYSCTTHSLVYQTDGSSWSTWATLTGTGLSDPMTTRGDMIVRNASNVTDRVAIGSTGKVWTSDGTDPSWQTPAAGGGGALVLLEQHTASTSAALNFTTAISATYDEYLIELISVIPATDAQVLWMRMSTDGGSTYDTGTNYHCGQWAFRAGGSSLGGGGGLTKITLDLDSGGGVSNTGTGGLSGTLRLFDPGNTTTYKRVLGQVVSWESAGSVWLATEIFGTYQSATAVNAFRFLFASGNIASGTIRVYGVAKT